jgi:peroxiredoxin
MMKYRSLMILAVLSLALFSVASAGVLTPGEAAPSLDVKMMSVDGNEFSIADVRGDKGTLVVFTCNACPYVKAWEDRIVALGNEFSAKGIGVIAINSNDPGKVAEDGYPQMQERAEAKGFGFPYVVDGTSDVARAFGATRTPEAFLFSAEGVLVYHGAVDNNAKDADDADQHYLRDALNALLDGEPVATPVTKAIGCTIKWHGE